MSHIERVSEGSLSKVWRNICEYPSSPVSYVSIMLSIGPTLLYSK